MSKNTKTYVLLGIVLLIWGVIGFRIASTLSSEPEVEVLAKRMSFNQIELSVQDTFLVKANYRDPFLGTLPKAKENKKARKVLKKQTFDLDVRFTGSMVNQGSGKRIYFVTVNGQQYLLQKGKKADEMLLVSGNANHIMVRYKGITKRIELQS